MDLSRKLEDMAAIAKIFPVVQDEEIDQETIARWRRLFGYSANEAKNQIAKLRQDPSLYVPEALWHAVREREEALGHDWESYSHWVELQKDSTIRLQCDSVGQEILDDNSEWLLKLEGPYSTVERLRQLLALSESPEVFKGKSMDQEADADFCLVDGKALRALLALIRKERPGINPTTVEYSRASKDFCSQCVVPMLGLDCSMRSLDCSMPQNRLTQYCETPKPMQNQYPVYYFFYGTLADSSTLHRLLGHLDGEDGHYPLQPAKIHGGTLRLSVGGTYKALIDGPSESELDGSAFLVASKDHEDALCFYETKLYEVVRCRIMLEGSSAVVEGCTFRFVGQLDPASCDKPTKLDND